jgi:hypothetical protein
MKRPAGIAVMVLALLCLARVGAGEPDGKKDGGPKQPEPPVKPRQDVPEKKAPAIGPVAEALTPPGLADLFSLPPEADLLTSRLPRAPEMQGDLGPPAPIIVLSTFPKAAGTTGAVTPAPGAAGAAAGTAGSATGSAAAPGRILLPGNRWFKVADNGSPRPQDRVYTTFNFYDDLNRSLNQQLGGTVQTMRLYRETVGFEKTFFDGAASIDVRLPFNSLDVASTTPGAGGSSSTFGDLAVTFKYALLRDVVHDNYLSLGLAVVAPTGTPNLAGFAPTGTSPVLVHDTIVQPYVGALRHFGKFYLQGFSALDVPTSRSDVTLWYNDVGLGYFAYQADDRSRWLTAVVPTLEGHVTTPLDHRTLPGGTSGTAAFDNVNLGAGVNVQMCGRAWFAAGVVTPVTGPRPFSVEVIAQFRLWF